MKKRMQKNFTKLMAATVAAVLLLSGCGGGLEKKIIGSWVWERYDSRTLDIYDNGSAKVERETYHWTLSDTTLTLTPDDHLNNNTEIYSVELKDDQLILSTDINTFVFNRAD